MVFILNRPALTILRKTGSRRSDALLELKGKEKKKKPFYFLSNIACAFLPRVLENCFLNRIAYILNSFHFTC